MDDWKEQGAGKRWKRTAFNLGWEHKLRLAALLMEDLMDENLKAQLRAHESAHGLTKAVDSGDENAKVVNSLAADNQVADLKSQSNDSEGEGSMAEGVQWAEWEDVVENNIHMFTTVG